MKVWVASNLWFYCYHQSKIYLLNKVQCYQRFWMESTVHRVEQTNLVAKKEAFASPKLGVERVALTLDMCEGSA